MQSNPLLISHARVWILHLLCQNTYRDQRLPLTWKDENFFAILPCACNMFFFLSPDFELSPDRHGLLFYHLKLFLPCYLVSQGGK